MLTITFQSRLSVWLLAVCLIPLPTATFAQLVCNGTPEGFDAGIPSGWSVIGTGGAGWSDLTACGETGNFTGGSGNAGCASSDAFGPGAFSTELRSPLFDLAGVSDASLRFALNYQSFAAADRLDLDLSADQGATWTTLLSLGDDRGAFRAPVGETVEVDLSAYAGQSDLTLRWHYHDPTDDAYDWYAQVDDAALLCDPIPLCGLGIPGRNRLADGGFETGTPSTAWLEQSANFPSPICTSTACGLGGADAGDAWSWFGGAAGAGETASLEQTAILYPPTAALTFSLWMPHSSGNGQDHLRLLIDGNEAWSVLEGDARYPGGYRRVEIDLSAFADGASHLLRVEAATSGSPTHTNIFIDDLELRGCPDVTAQPEVAITDATVVEGDAGIVNLAVTVTLSHPWSQDVSVDYATADGTAVAGIDYAGVSGTLDVPAGQTGGQIVVPVYGDLLAEGDEVFSVALSGAANATLFDAQATATLVDDDGQLAIADVTVSEGDYGTVDALFSVTLSPPSSRAVEVDFTTADATGPGAAASAGVDYLAAAGTLTFPPGTTQQTIAVKVLGERLDELDESFLARLVHPVAAKLLDAEGQATIIDDDDAAISIGDATVTEADTESVQAAFSVTLSTASDRVVTVDAATADGTAIAGDDYLGQVTTLTFQASLTEQTLSIEVLGDELDEDDESFTVTLANPSQATLADAVAVGTIADNDTLEISVDDAAPAGEQDAGRVDAVFTVSLSLVNLETVSVDYATVDDTATAGADYQPLSGTLTFAPGGGPQTVPVPLLDDGIDETDETFVLELSQPENATLGRASAIGTIIDDDGVVAVVGGPYAGDEGQSITFDASGSSHPNGTIDLYEWDLDLDGDYDDAVGITAAWSFGDNGSFTIGLRVTDQNGETDTATAEVVVANLAPAIEAGPDQVVIEGITATLIGASFTDPGPGDTHTATIDWGDGSPLEAGVVDQAAGTVGAGHDYPDDGVFSVETCVIDDDGDSSCDSFLVTVQNEAPSVVENSPSGVDLRTWTAEDPFPAAGDWQVAADGLSVRQELNVDPTFFYGDFIATGVTLEGLLRVQSNSDDDFIGMALGFLPGDTASPEADFLLLDWKKASQQAMNLPCIGTQTMPRGLALSRARGTVPRYFYQIHIGDSCDPDNPDGARELARGMTRGSVGWQSYTDYLFTIELKPDHLRVWVNGTLEFDLAGDFDFGNGKYAFYNFSQEKVLYRSFSALGLAMSEGSEAHLAVQFNDVGVLDTHTASIDWQDGVVEAGTVVEAGGSGTITGSHVYPEDAVFGIEVCVEDDDGGVGCGTVEATVNNLPPVVDAGDDRLAYLDEGFDLAVDFTDAGVLDTHTATIDWGDGTAEDAAVNEADGAGTASGLHVYDAEGSYTVRVCVTDDDGGTSCDSLEVLCLAPVLDLTVSKTASLRALRPDELMTYEILVTNSGTREPSNVTVTDVLPDYLIFIDASDGGVFDPASRTVSWAFPHFSYQAQQPLSVTVQGQSTLPVDTPIVNSVSVADDGSLGADQNPADNFDSAAVVLWDGVTPRVDLHETIELVEGIPYNFSVGFDDTGPTEVHTATIDWGDGTIETASVSENGGSGSISGSHAYADDLSSTLTVCVTDSAGNAGCGSIPLIVNNFLPEVNDDSDIDLRTWQVEHWFTGHDLPNWVVAGDGLSALQTINAEPSVFYGDFPAFGRRIRGRIEVESNRDDDYVGFALGYRPADNTNEDADFLLLDWKKATTGTNPVGMAVTRVTGPDPAFNGHNNQDSQELARAINLGNVGWVSFQEYEFVFELSANRLRVFVDGQLEFDLEGDFQDGRFAFYNFSQELVHYRAFEVEALVSEEGQIVETLSSFVDLGLDDTHTATTDWQDGSVEPVDVDFGNGTGFVSGSHLYLDDARFETEVCVTDDDLGTGCGVFPIQVYNVAPIVDAGLDTTAGVGMPFVLSSPTFTDPGTLDTHTATVDWGDGSPLEAATVNQDAGSGTIEAQHDYLALGTYDVEVCVTDDDGGVACDSLVVTASSITPPEVSSLSIPDSTEGDTVQLSAQFLDPDPGDSFTATIDWGDGSPLESGSVTPAAGGGSVSGSHSYRDDLASTVEVCVTDSAGLTGCDSVPVAVDNFVPEVAGVHDLSTWQFEYYNSGYDTPQWQLFADPTSVHQTESSKPTIFYGDESVLGRRFTTKVSVRATSGQGFIGLALGYRPGDVTNPSPDYVYIDWRQRTASGGSLVGMAVSRVTGPAAGFWNHSNDIHELSRAFNLGSVGWVDWQEYELTVEMTSDRLRFWVDGTLEFDLSGVFQDGRFGFFCYAQQNVRFRDFRLEGLALDEGEAADLSADFFDAGPDDTHTAAIDWQDGSPWAPGTVIPNGQGGDVTASHVYGDDGDFPAQLCVTDDDGGAGCADFTIVVRNVAPAVEAGADAAASAGVIFELDAASFTDPGTGDTHTATVDWGDGTTGVPVVIKQPGGGTLEAQHVFTTPGSYTVELCVTDDDGASACDTLQVDVTGGPPELIASKADALVGDVSGDGVANPGDTIGYTVSVSNIGLSLATGVVLIDQIPAHTAIVASSVTASQGTVVSANPVNVDLGTLGPAAAATVSFQVRVDDPFPSRALAVLNQAVVSSTELADVHSDDPSAPGEADPTVTEVFIIPEVSIGDVAVTEGDPGDMVLAVFDVTLSEASNRPVAVDYATADGSALAGADYLPASGTLDFAAGETAHTVAASVLGDELLEPDGETFSVDLSNPVDSALGDHQGEGTVLDDEVCAGPNLLLNPDAEARPEGGDAAGAPPPSWIEVEGNEWQRRVADPDPASGVAYFSPGTAPLAELAQDVDVSAYAARIVGGDQQFAFEGLVQTRDEVPLDVARILVEYRDATNSVVLEAYDSGEITSPLAWHELADVRAAPAGTGWIRVRLLATAFTAGDNDGYFDTLSLRSLRSSTLTIDDVTVYEGDAGTADALFKVRLSCPYERQIEVSFASADGGAGLPPALVVSDYLETLGTLTLSVGEIEGEIAVPVVGDDVHEHHEGFTVTLSDPLADGLPDLGQAVLLDPAGVGTIANGDFCARSPGFWKNHVEDWPTDYLVIGGVEIDAQTMHDLLSYNGPDASNHLARQLIATKLNLLVGSDPYILPVVADADAFLEIFPPGSNPRGSDKQQANAIKDEFDAYNNPDCVQTPVDPG